MVDYLVSFQHLFAICVIIFRAHRSTLALDLLFQSAPHECRLLDSDFCLFGSRSTRWLGWSYIRNWWIGHGDSMHRSPKSCCVRPVKAASAPGEFGGMFLWRSADGALWPFRVHQFPAGLVAPIHAAAFRADSARPRRGRVGHFCVSLRAHPRHDCRTLPLPTRASAGSGPWVKNSTN